ncbi:hypothetical protein [Mycetocola miduiensis]|uniref:Alpha/beta hydrolase family protein n=1 Tax=Mycetocola miduiensis TaxID=995034 RepID=A0A1I5CCA4_9MICO|nr:hypothetical protein [Mycetocola miduiensis]SFN84514.1 hypothetical protein SAMN05216219_2336 [Mycetocola miduiensis]
MQDDIDISNGSTISVDTDDLFEAAASLSALAGEARDWSHEAAIARCVTEWSADAAPFGLAEPELTRASAMLQEAAADAETLGVEMRYAAVGYAEADQRNRDASRLIAAVVGFLSGGFLRNLVLGTLPLAPMIGVTLLVTQHPEMRRLLAIAGQPLANALADTSYLLVTPAFVDLIRVLVSSADDVAMGAAGLSPVAAHLLGDEGAGVVGLSSMAGALLLLSGRNAYTPTPLDVTRTARSPVSAPTTLADAAARIPPSGTGSPQIRVERYADRNGQPAYAVYLAGTSDFSTGGDEPFDMGSNLAGIAGSDTAAQQATVDAMDDAGVRPGDPVSFFGHSQGGLVAARIAASGVYSTQALVTFGSPTGQIAVPDQVAHVAVEHAEDITPALGGEPLGGTAGRDRIVVSRGLVDESGPAPSTSLASSHHMAQYAETAALIDKSTDPRLDRMREALAGLAGSGPGTGATYRAERDRR